MHCPLSNAGVPSIKEPRGLQRTPEGRHVHVRIMGRLGPYGGRNHWTVEHVCPGHRGNMAVAAIEIP